MERAVFSRREVRRILNEFVVVELHLDGAPERISDAVRARHSALAQQYAKQLAMPYYIVLNPHDLQLINLWGWEDADLKRWQARLEDALMRWKNRQ